MSVNAPLQPEAQPTKMDSLDNKNEIPQKATANAVKRVPAHYLIRIKGQAAITGGDSPQSVIYDEIIRCPLLGEGKADGHYMTFCLRDDLEQGSLLAKAIAKTHGHCEAIRTHQLISRIYVDEQGNKTEAKNIKVVNGQQLLQLSQMRYIELEEYIKERKYEIELNLYPSTDDLKRAIESYEKNKDEFLTSQDKVREEFRIKEDAAMLASLDEEEKETLDI